MHTLIYLTGEQATGKTTLCGLMRKALEIKYKEIRLIDDPESIIDKNKAYFESIVITCQEKSEIVEGFLKTIAVRNKVKFYSIHLTKSK